MTPGAAAEPAADGAADGAAASTGRAAQPGVILAALVLTAALLGTAVRAGGLGMAAPVLLGAAAGWALHGSGFGFASAWRALARDRRGEGVRAQILLIGLISAVAFPLIAWGEALGLPARGVVLPMGAASAIGAAMFGAGMQLGGGCASGTLYTVGGGSAKMGVTLGFFVAGSVLATAHWEVWAALPATRAGWSLVGGLGPLPAIAVMGAALAGAWALTRAVERGGGAPRPTPPETPPAALPVTLPAAPPFTRRLRWRPVTGALALAAVGIGCFALLRRPWGVTWGFALWGAKAAQGLGIPAETWTYWQGWRGAALARPALADATSVMNLGIVAGALFSAGLAGRFAPTWRIPPRALAGAAAGGLLMGYGARLAYGCNIGAFLGGLTSGSLHGLWWLAWAVAGTWAGLRLRRALRLDPA